MCGILPVGDAFVIHATTARPWLRDPSDFSVQPTPVSGFWRCGVHLLTLLAALLIALIWWLRKLVPKALGLSRKPSEPANPET
jgi:hypothetical protein